MLAIATMPFGRYASRLRILRLSEAWRGCSRAFTLVDLAIGLAMLVTVALVLTPSIANVINDARVTRARNDCDAIGTAILKFYKDAGFFPASLRAGDGRSSRRGHPVKLLVGPGNVPAFDRTLPGTGGWSSAFADPDVGRLADQLNAGSAGTFQGAAAGSRPNGQYLPPGIGTDPWNNRYMVNVAFLEPVNEVEPAAERPRSAVFVLSAGPNGTVETRFSQPAVSARVGGDDIVSRIQ